MIGRNIPLWVNTYHRFMTSVKRKRACYIGPLSIEYDENNVEENNTVIKSLVKALGKVETSDVCKGWKKKYDAAVKSYEEASDKTAKTCLLQVQKRYIECLKAELDGYSKDDQTDGSGSKPSTSKATSKPKRQRAPRKKTPKQKSIDILKQLASIEKIKNDLKEKLKVEKGKKISNKSFQNVDIATMQKFLNEYKISIKDTYQETLNEKEESIDKVKELVQRVKDRITEEKERKKEEADVAKQQEEQKIAEEKERKKQQVEENERKKQVEKAVKDIVNNWKSKKLQRERNVGSKNDREKMRRIEKLKKKRKGRQKGKKRKKNSNRENLKL